MPGPNDSGQKPGGNQPGGESASWHEQKNGDRAARSGKNLADNRAIGVPDTPVKPEDVGQLPDPDAQ